MASQGGYTCITCRVAFVDPDLQRSHYKTDWHRYNLKRKVAELPPVTAENFKERVLAQRAVETVEAKHEFCQICKKHFTSENSYQSHLRSRRHKEREITVQKLKAQESKKSDPPPDEQSGVDDGVVERNEKNLKDGETEKELAADSQGDEDSDSEFEPEPLEITECLFCPQTSDNLEFNLKHMSFVHGFFIPDLTYLVDVKGLIMHLCEKVGVGNMCLYCNEKGKMFHSIEAAQHHMVDKCHCKIFFEGDAALEYAEFYDYTKSYPDYKDDRGAKTEEGGDDDTMSADTVLKVTDDLELVLPSGAKVGHRAMKQIYKQHLPTVEQRRSAVIGRLMSQYRALGWKGYGGGEVGKKREKDEMWVRRMEQARITRLSTKANKFQKHFRPQVVF